MSKYFTHYRVRASPDSSIAWLVVGPVWTGEGRRRGFMIQIGSHGFAIHGGVK